jgi:hypothetical protein
VFDIVAECSRGRDCQVDVDGSMYELGIHQSRDPSFQSDTHLLTSEGNFLSFQSPLLNSPPSIGKSVLSTPFNVQGVPGFKESLRT